jgi:O-antigen/teichoic acid export membrane protein
MSSRFTIFRNVVWNWAGVGVQNGAGFIVAPFLVNTMGDTGYGMWILIASLTGYFDVLDLGLRTSVGRTLALHRAEQDRNGITATVTTGLLLLCIQAVLVVVGTLVAIRAFFHLFEVPAGQEGAVQTALVLVAINLAVIYVFSIFDALIWSMQRFDLLNAVDIPAVVIRATLTLALVTPANGLRTLAWITLSVTLAGGIAKAIIALRLDPAIRVDIRSLSWRSAHGLFSYGSWCFLMSLAKISTTQLGPIVIGSRLAISQVTPFSIAARLVTLAKSLQVVSTGVFTPMATAYHAGRLRSSQEKLFLDGGRHCLALGVFFVGYFSCLGGPLLTLWIGPRMQQALPLLLIMIVGELIPLSQGITNSLLLGMASHRALALASICELCGSLMLIPFLVGPYGVLGAAIAFAIPASLARGIVPLVQGAREFGVSLPEYGRQTVLPVLALAAGPLIGIVVLTWWHSPATWFELILYSAAYTLAYSGAGIISTFGLGALNPFQYATVRSLSGQQDN